MIIAVQPELEKLKIELENKGYVVVEFGEYYGHIDAIIYHQQDDTEGQLTQLISSTFRNENILSNDSKHVGAILINAYKKDIEYIDYILSNRLYSPLF
ncbi:MAG: YkuS family protein [Clostridia bacterium]|nr:YkuS family protein [Clostridia bacterium]